MLYLTAEGQLSENIKSISVKDSEEAPAEYAFKIVCTDCREEHDSNVLINRFEKHEMPGSRGEASFLLKCKFCSKDCSVNMSQFERDWYNNEVESNEENLTKVSTHRKKNGLKNISKEIYIPLEFDCRNCEIIGFEPSSVVFEVELVSGSKLECQFDQGENEWYDYDDDAGEEVSITDMKFDVSKGK
ncbi:hypothetical protein Kpol_1028p19 [Vanderwaltozyma polyspora DSM 70294]|uniref:Uncharacterized protein n=1 Tax=Vanderwaltozyma polyspora (strain ATCC 22028 / DSM 70294 / BCRC 21397 / CBS 2163 / NBRC 10782 / NRRL Y-8283 / UCD 57-17) TaxID=436907 RepID=A7TFY9_VANPO|nr:uncharacterized protein Kpol_1028p19 [Vanderwaltozyma polyspora DSM 70294]EDO18746.1 hypothetical protein Kpol_1028p19 [Vanderwaltozyma polyspora DSM 70294]